MLHDLSPDSFNTILSFLESYQKTLIRLSYVNSSIYEILSRIEHHKEFIICNQPKKLIAKRFMNISLKKKIFTDKVFEYFKNLHTLDMSYCKQTTITDKAFLNLKNLHTLDMSNCDQTTITDKAFLNLQNLHTLDIRYCMKNIIANKILQYLKNIPNLRK